MGWDEPWTEDEPFHDRLWQEAERRAREVAEGCSKPRAGYVGCPMSWLQRVLPLVSSKEQLVVALLMYPRLRSDKAVPIPNGEFGDLEIDRRIKPLTLRKLEEAGLIAVEYTAGRTIRAKLL